MSQRTARGIAALVLVVAALAAVTAAAGVFARGTGEFAETVSVRGEVYRYATDGAYAYSPEALVAEGIGWDVFTLFVAAPALLVAVPFVARGSLRARLVAAGLLGYAFYQYFMYAMAWALGPLLPLFIAVYALSLAGIVWIVSTIPLAGLAESASPRFPRRSMVALCVLMALLLTGMWSGLIAAGLRGDLEGARLAGQNTLVVQALDLGLMVPLLLFTAWAIWKRRAVGHLLGTVVVVKAVAMAFAICAMLVSAWAVTGEFKVAEFAVFGGAAVAAVWIGVRMYASIADGDARSASTAGLPRMAAAGGGLG